MNVTTQAIPTPRTASDDQATCVEDDNPRHTCRGNLVEFTCCDENYCTAIEDDHALACDEHRAWVR